MWPIENRHRYDPDRPRYPSDLTDAGGGAGLVAVALALGCRDIVRRIPPPSVRRRVVKPPALFVVRVASHELTDSHCQGANS
jgi:hypothetical protein